MVVFGCACLISEAPAILPISAQSHFRQHRLLFCLSSGLRFRGLPVSPKEAGVLQTGGAEGDQGSDLRPPYRFRLKAKIGRMTAGEGFDGSR